MVTGSLTITPKELEPIKPAPPPPPSPPSTSPAGAGSCGQSNLRRRLASSPHALRRPHLPAREEHSAGACCRDDPAIAMLHALPHHARPAPGRRRKSRLQLCVDEGEHECPHKCLGVLILLTLKKHQDNNVTSSSETTSHSSAGHHTHALRRRSMGSAPSPRPTLVAVRALAGGGVPDKSVEIAHSVVRQALKHMPSAPLSSGLIYLRYTCLIVY